MPRSKLAKTHGNNPSRWSLSSSALDFRVVPPVGGVMLFSAAQLHSSVPNFTRKTD